MERNKYVLPFDEFCLNESAEGEITSYLVRDVMETIHKTSMNDADQDSYIEYIDEHYDEPFRVNFILHVKRHRNPDFETDEKFKKLPWEKINFDQHGFSIDAATQPYTDEDETPEVMVDLLINPDREPELYVELFYKLQDAIRHEFQHLTQGGPNKKHGRVPPSSMAHREEADDSYKYFLLPDEIPAMIAGMERRAKLEKRPFESILIDYLTPFLKYKFLTKDQFDEILKTYLEYRKKNA
jgi:hypothetical protein